MIRKSIEDRERLSVLKVDRQTLLAQKKETIQKIKDMLKERRTILNKYKKA
jgi:hypothetical protein